MGNILHIISSASRTSNSILLGNRIIEKLQARYPGSTVVTNDVTSKIYDPLRDAYVAALKTPAAQLTPEQQALLRASDEAVQQLQEADHIVIGIPLYNFTIPAHLKAWIDQIVRPAITVSYRDGKPVGLLENKKVYLAIASNGVYSDGPMQPYDFADPYIRYIFSFIGITDVTTFRIEGNGISGIKETAVEKGLAGVVL